MPFPKKRSPLQFSEQEKLKLESIRKSRTEEKRRTLRAAFLLDSLSGQSDETIARHHHVSRSTVVLCLQKFLQFGLDAALGELPRTGKPRQLPDDAIAYGSWLNLIENQFSKMTRTMLRGIRVTSKQELIDRISSILRPDQCGPDGISLEVQDGRDLYSFPPFPNRISYKIFPLELTMEMMIFRGSSIFFKRAARLRVLNL